MTTEWIIAAIALALVLAVVSVVRASELEPEPRKRRITALAFASCLGTLAVVPVVGLLDVADWSWVALGPLLGCAAVAIGPELMRLIRKKGKEL